MVRRTYPQRTLVEVLLPDADKLWDPVLREIDLVLDDEDLVDQVTAALGDGSWAKKSARLPPPAVTGLSENCPKTAADGGQLRATRARAEWRFFVAFLAPGYLASRRTLPS